MRIVEETPDRLTLEDRPWVLGTVLAIVILVMALIALLTVAENIWLGLGMALGAALFGAAFVAFVRRVIVIFDRRAGAVVIRTASLTGQTEATHPLADIRGAGVDTSISRSTSQGSGRSSVSTTHRTILHLPDGDVPLTEVYSGGDAAARMAEAVNRWLGTPHT
ncbi:MAG: hypothetical protein NTW20_14330 [Rhodobacterales bacterium]|nr:hypothetical protein [Rhodobacterales bacterium]